jgi:hypothetical protein
MRENGDCGPLSGEVEVDETFIGGKERNKHVSRRRHLGTGSIGKCAVMGLRKRHGTVRAKTVKTVRKGLLREEIKRNVAPGSTV